MLGKINRSLLKIILFFVLNKLVLFYSLTFIYWRTTTMCVNNSQVYILITRILLFPRSDFLISTRTWPAWRLMAT